MSADEVQSAMKEVGTAKAWLVEAVQWKNTLTQRMKVSELSMVGKNCLPMQKKICKKGGDCCSKCAF